MREIKFRGKALWNGQWVYGMPFFQDDKAFIVVEGHKVAVDKETICEYIGLHTINGMEVYENDIYIVEANVKNTMPRHIIQHIAGFTGKQLGIKCKCYGRSSIQVDEMEAVQNQICVIGNSIDNPELLNVTQRTRSELFEVAADWWIDKTFGKFLNQNNGEESHFVYLNYVALKGKEKVTEEQIKKFKEIFIDSLSKEDKCDFYLGVDYHPGQYLNEACEKSGIPEICLPCKTNMNIHVSEGYICANFGYGAPYINI